MIDHSLGGAAVLAAAPQLPSVEAVVTIGARSFPIKHQLLDDLARHADASDLGRLGRALLVFHSPMDKIVSIDEAARTDQAAKHPKSFTPLDNADHLLSSRDDAEYVAETIVARASRYLNLGRHESERRLGTTPAVSEDEVLVTERQRLLEVADRCPVHRTLESDLRVLTELTDTKI